MMNNEKMLEMMEFFEFYEAYKNMKSQKTVSARTETVEVKNTNINTPLSIESGRFVQRGDDIVDLGENKNIDDVLTKFEKHEQVDINGTKYYCIKSGMCTKKKKIDKNGQPILNKWGKQDYYKFNFEAYEIAKNMIKSLDGIITVEIPFKDKDGNTIKYKKPWFAWGFKTEKECLKAVEILPKVVKGEDIKKMRTENQEKKNGGK